MKKIGILVNSMNFGGNERSAANIAKSLKNRFDVCIITQEQNNSIESNVSIFNLDTPCKKGFFGKVQNSFIRFIRLRKLIKKEKIDTVLVILAVSNVLNYLPLGCERIVSCRDCGDLMKNAGKYLWMTMLSKKIVFNSKYQENYFYKKYRVKKNKRTTIYNILDTDSIMDKIKEPVEKEFISFIEGKECIISMGRFVDVKGFSNLLKSFYLAQLKKPTLRLILIGDGVLKNKICDLIQKLELTDKVMLLGYRKNPFKYIAKCSIFALPSYSEGFPNVLLEALACSVPVVATDCPSGPREILDANYKNELEHVNSNICYETGVLCPIFERSNEWNPTVFYDSNSQFAEALLTVLDNNSEMNYKENTRKRALEFSEGHIVNEWIKIFQ